MPQPPLPYNVITTEITPGGENPGDQNFAYYRDPGMKTGNRLAVAGYGF